MNHDIDKLFSITQAAKVCGLSRSTLMRMEEKGLLAPAYIAPHSGRRYYDNFNIARILQIQQFQSMGFGREETTSYFSTGGNAKELLSILENRLNLLQRSVEEIRLRAMSAPNMSVQILTLPEMTCCVRRHIGLTIQEKYDALYSFYHECIENSCLLAPKPLLIISERTDYLEGKLSSAPYPFHACVPVLPEKAPADAVFFPSCTALSVLCYGDYGHLDEAWLKLGREANARGLTPAAFPRSIAIVAPYTGREIDPKQYCTRLVMPLT